MKARIGLTIFSLLLSFTMDDADAQPNGFNYEESKVPQFTLPDPLTADDESKVTTTNQWVTARRPELLALFEDQMFGRQPAKPANMVFDVTSVERGVLGGKAVRKQVTVHLLGANKPEKMYILIYLPLDATGPVPVFVGYNFNGNHTVNADPGIDLPTSWVRDNKDKGADKNKATEAGRGTSSSRWAVDMILDRGYGLATIYYGDIEPDHKDGWKDGVRAKLKTDKNDQPLALEEWSAISAWSWGLSRVMDYFEKDENVDSKRVALMGHSRLGKTSLWGGATDERFAIVISNDSGCGGAALSKRAFGETVKRINTSFPHWFNRNFKQYDDNEASLPFDQHELIALIAPRPVYVASAVEDRWADPKGEFLSAKYAGPVYELFGKGGVGVEEQPPVDQSVGDYIGYHIRSGGHDVKDYDWEQYLNFADRHLVED